MISMKVQFCYLPRVRGQPSAGTALEVIMTNMSFVMSEHPSVPSEIKATTLPVS